MDPVLVALATEGGKELVKALAGGLIGGLKKLPNLWRHGDDEQRMAAELERSAAELTAAGHDETAGLRVQVTWETRLRDLLAGHPELAPELREIVGQLREENARVTQHVEQRITAEGQGSTAQGAMFGNIINHPGPGQ